MAPPEPVTVAEGDLDTGEHWILTAGGTSKDFDTFIEIIHPNGHREKGGFKGPILYRGKHANTYAGNSDTGPLRLIGRTGPKVSRVYLELGDDEPLDLPLLGDITDFGVRFFVAVLPPTTQVRAMVLLDGAGRELERHTDPAGGLPRYYGSA